MDDWPETPEADALDAGGEIDFVPDPRQLAPRAQPAPAPTWLAASIAVTVALLLGVSLAVRPAAAVAHGATGDAAGDDAAETTAAGDTASTHQDLFQLPAWHDGDANDKTTAVADAR